jgi:hypothetical protein
MALGITSLISGLAGPISNIINKFISKKEDQMLAQAELDKITSSFKEKILDNQKSILEAQRDLIVTEMQGSAMQRNWRPALMWIIIFVIANNYLLAPFLNHIVTLFGGGNILPILELPDKLFNLMTIGLGGYVIGRSAEKIIPKLKEISADNERIAGAMSSGKGPKNRDVVQVEKEYNKKEIAKMTPGPLKF